MEKEIIKFQNIQGITFIDSAPGYFPPHWHNEAEFYLIKKDCSEFRIRDELYTLYEGDILLIWPRELHEIVSHPENGSLFVQFSSNMIENHFDILSSYRFISTCHMIRAKDNPDLAENIKNILLETKEIYDKNPYFCETRCRICIYRILLLIGEFVLEEKREQFGRSNYSATSLEYIRNACGYIAEHSTEDISQSEVAAKTGLSPFYFSKLFKEYTGTSFPAYLSRIRVGNAISLLSDESLSITECAFSSGFQSTTAFNKVFREITGCSPREYRKLHHRYENSLLS